MSAFRYAISLDMINRHYSEPNRNRYESKYYWEELYTLIAAAGFNRIEIPYEPVWQFGGRSGVPMTQYSINTKYGDAKQYKAFLADAGIDAVSAISFDANLFVRNDQLGFYFGASGHFASQAIEFAGELEAECLILSPTAYAGRLQHYHPNLTVDDASFVEQTRELISNLAGKAKAAGVKLALRPEYWSLLSLKTLTHLVAESDNHVGIALNTAHLQLAGADTTAFIADNAARISYIQLADTQLNDSTSFRHAANPAFPPAQATQVFSDVGCGEVPLTQAMQSLQQAGYSGQVSLCNHQTRDPMRALLRNRRFVNQLATQLTGA